MKRQFMTLLLMLLVSSLSGQDLLKKMQVKDISRQKDIKTTIVRNPQHALLVVRSEIPDLTFTSNNRILKTTDKGSGVWHLLVAPGTHRITFKGEGYQPITKRIFFAEKQTRGVSVGADPKSIFSVVNIRTAPAGAEVLIDGKLAGVTPLLDAELSAGTYKLSVQKTGFIGQELVLTLKPGEEQSHYLDLAEEVLGHTLKITTTPAKAEVWINGQGVGRTPFSQRFTPNSQVDVIIKMDGYNDWRQSYIMDQDLALVVNLNDSEVAGVVKEGGSRKWLYIAGGGAVVVGAVAAIVLSGGGGNENTDPGIGQPVFPGSQ